MRGADCIEDRCLVLDAEYLDANDVFERALEVPGYHRHIIHPSKPELLHFPDSTEYYPSLRLLLLQMLVMSITL